MYTRKRWVPHGNPPGTPRTRALLSSPWKGFPLLLPQTHAVATGGSSARRASVYWLRAQRAKRAVFPVRTFSIVI